tara:strand:- start:1167 stop:2702 length:1536 start_codon:yes stop_codon:yes gene_type:complete
MSNAKRLLKTFEGSSLAHGRTTVGNVGRNGKTEAKYTVLREPLTDTVMQHHIEGKQGVNSIPINSDNKCKFGCLDIDIYDLDLAELNKKIRKLKLPLFQCRSKSGGAHLFLFLKDWEPAALVREYLLEMSIVLGFASDCEIFPKQDKIMADRGDVGSHINVPYFNAEQTMRYCFDSSGQAMELEEFLNAVEKGRVSIAELNEMDLGGKRENFTDGPYCLEVMTSLGKVTKFRNIFMFSVGVYCRMKWPDDWKKHHEEYNRKFCSPALPSKEVADIQSSLDKKEYFYTCETCPLKDHCDKDLCKTRPYGVGNETLDLPSMGGLTIIQSQPRLYFMDVEGKRVELSTDQLVNQNLWAKACVEQISYFPSLMKPNKWNSTINQMLQQGTYLEVTEEFTYHGQFKDHLRNYCTSRVRAISPDELQMGKPWTEGGVTKFTIDGLMEYLNRQDWKHWTKAQVQEGIKALNTDSNGVGHQNIMRGGKRTSIRVWFVPSFEQDELELPTKENDNDEIPF